MSYKGANNELYTIISEDIDLLTTGTTTLLTNTDVTFVKSGTAELEITALSGTIAAAPTVSIGNTGSFDQVCAATTPNTGDVVVNAVLPLTDASPIKSVDLSSGALRLNVSVAASGLNVLTGRLVINYTTR
jgi:hypothetical protein